MRALEPVEGLELMQRRRGTEDPRDLCRGPGRLCAALDIDRSFDGAELFTRERLWLESGQPRGPVRRSRRIGLTRAAHRRLRFYEAGNPYVSGPARLSPP